MLHTLLIIENNQLSTYRLEDRSTWQIGRITMTNQPDIPLHLPTISRNHGFFENMDGFWFYIDNNTTNGTLYNKTPMLPDTFGRRKPTFLAHGDVLVLGTREPSAIPESTVWAFYFDNVCTDDWRIAYTGNCASLIFSDGTLTSCYTLLQKGMVDIKPNGLAIYMGEYTFLHGNMTVQGQ